MTTDLTGILRGTHLLRSVPARDLEDIVAASRLRWHGYRGLARVGC